MSEGNRPRSRGSQGRSGADDRPRKESRPRGERSGGKAEGTPGGRRGAASSAGGRPGGGDSPRSRSPSSRPGPAGASSAEELLELADEIEQHARGLLSQARSLQRMAERLSSSGDRPARRSGGPRSTERGAEQPRRRSAPGQSRTPEDREGGRGGKDETAPSWAPPPRKRRS